MGALWRCGPLSAQALLSEVRAAQPWGDPTIKTLLGRLMRKHAIRSERVDGRQRYVALLTRGDYVGSEVRALVDRLFDGRPDALAALLDEQRG